MRSREILDVCDTSRYGDYVFDVVLAHGGPLSYAFEEAESALAVAERSIWSIPGVFYFIFR